MHRNARESISCVPRTGSRQVHLRNKAASISHSCNQRSAQDAPGLQGQETTRTVPGEKKRVLFLPAQTIQQSQQHHSRPSKPITLEARGARDFRVLPASCRVLSGGISRALRPRRCYSCGAHAIARPLFGIQPIGGRRFSGTNGEEPSEASGRRERSGGGAGSGVTWGGAGWLPGAGWAGGRGAGARREEWGCRPRRGHAARAPGFPRSAPRPPRPASAPAW